MVAVRSAIFNVAFYVNVIVLMIVGLPMMLRGPKGVITMAQLWGRSSLWLAEHICGLRLEFRGLSNIPDGGYILASKHESFLETFSLILNSDDFAIILKKALTRIPLFGLYLTVSDQIAIDRAKGRSAMSQIVEQAKPALAKGRMILIFPEGTRRAPGAEPDYKFGVASIYAATGAPCLPVALNTGLFWRRRGFRRYPGVAVIEYLPPIPPGLEPQAFLARLQSDIETACARLNEEACSGDPALRAQLAGAVVA